MVSDDATTDATTDATADATPEDTAGNTAGLPEGYGSVAVFEVAGRLCAVPTARIQEVVLLPELARPPGLPSVLEGFLNLGGKAVPVVRLARVFGFGETELGLYTPLVLLRGVDPPVALLADRVREVRRLDSAEVASIGGDDVFNRCLVGEAAVDGEPLHLVDPDRILLEEEGQRLAEFQAWAQDRLEDWPAPGVEEGA